MILAVVIINYYTPCSCFEFDTMVNRVRLLCPFVAFCGFFVFLVLHQRSQNVMGVLPSRRCCKDDVDSNQSSIIDYVT